MREGMREQVQTKSSGSWFVVPAYTLLGLGLLWWANDQFLRMQLGRGAPIEMRQTRILLWIVTLIVAGIAFGFALAASHRWAKPPRIGVLAASSLLPLSIVVYFYVVVALRLLPNYTIDFLFRFAFSEGTITASSLVVGFFISGMTSHLLTRHAEHDDVATEAELNA